MLTIWGAFTPQYFCDIQAFHSQHTRHISSQKLTQVSGACLRYMNVFLLSIKTEHIFPFILIHSEQKEICITPSDYIEYSKNQILFWTEKQVIRNVNTIVNLSSFRFVIMFLNFILQFNFFV